MRSLSKIPSECSGYSSSFGELYLPVIEKNTFMTTFGVTGSNLNNYCIWHEQS